jgi:hypothetical protein
VTADDVMALQIAPWVVRVLMWLYLTPGNPISEGFVMSCSVNTTASFVLGALTSSILLSDDLKNNYVGLHTIFWQSSFSGLRLRYLLNVSVNIFMGSDIRLHYYHCNNWSPVTGCCCDFFPLSTVEALDLFFTKFWTSCHWLTCVAA